jgi:2-polyprenyl-3-methyl-5-hydroxy-6-metoxy-1,4-benzoquinol methylase
MLDSFSKEVQNHPLGFLELKKKPCKEDLKAYYENRYYQLGVRTHRSRYSEQELVFRENKCIQKRMLVENIWKKNKSSSPALLDIGSGEGFVLDHFYRSGYEVTGIDYSDHGCKNHHPHLMQYLHCGDIEEIIEKFNDQSHRYDLIILDNVLEHLLEPGRLIERISGILNDNGVLVIEVPNDFSIVQNHLLEKKKISKPFWIASPDHVSYFNAEGLNNLLSHHGFELKEMVADFPIDLFLFNEKTNYVNDSTAGKHCHQARIEIENLLHAHNPWATLKMYAAMASLGVGRQIMGLYQVRKS